VHDRKSFLRTVQHINDGTRKIFVGSNSLHHHYSAAPEKYDDSCSWSTHCNNVRRPQAAGSFVHIAAFVVIDYSYQKSEAEILKQNPKFLTYQAIPRGGVFRNIRTHPKTTNSENLSDSHSSTRMSSGPPHRNCYALLDTCLPVI
jgi:hypothetical protein